MKIHRHCMVLAFGALGLLLMTGCGGSSSAGMEEFQSSVRGTLVSSEGAPIPDARVRVAGTPDFGVTDELGEFLFATTFPDRNVTLLVEFDGSEGMVTLEDIPRPAALFVELVAQLKEDGLVVEAREVLIAVP